MKRHLSFSHRGSFFPARPRDFLVPRQTELLILTETHGASYTRTKCSLLNIKKTHATTVFFTLQIINYVNIYFHPFLSYFVLYINILKNSGYVLNSHILKVFRYYLECCYTRKIYISKIITLETFIQCKYFEGRKPWKLSISVSDFRTIRIHNICYNI